MHCTCVEQHVGVEAALEGEAPPTLQALEGLVGVGHVHRLVGLQLQQPAEGLAAVLTAQGLLGLLLAPWPRLLPPGPSPPGPGPGHGAPGPPHGVHRPPRPLRLHLGGRLYGPYTELSKKPVALYQRETSGGA